MLDPCERGGESEETRGNADGLFKHLLATPERFELPTLRFEVLGNGMSGVFEHCLK